MWLRPRQISWTVGVSADRAALERPGRDAQPLRREMLTQFYDPARARLRDDRPAAPDPLADHRVGNSIEKPPAQDFPLQRREREQRLDRAPHVVPHRRLAVALASQNRRKPVSDRRMEKIEPTRP